MKLATILGLSLVMFRMAEDAPAAVPAVVDAEPAPVEPVSVTVPAEHVVVVSRLLALLEKDATWLKDNIEAGLTHFEGMFKSAPEVKGD